jgi:hypothetical protein
MGEAAKRLKISRLGDWDKVGFYLPEYKGAKTESMPRLYSKSYSMVGKTWTLSGGVSLAPKELFEKAQVISTSLDKPIRRSNLDYGSGGLNRNSLRTLEGVEYNLKAINPEHLSVSAIAREGTKLRNRTGELANLKFERIMVRDPKSLLIEARVADGNIGDLNITKTVNGFKIGWRGRDLEEGYAIARRLSKSPDPAIVLMSDPSVLANLELPGDGGFLVKLEGSDRWLKMTPEQKPSAEIAKGYQARVADPEGTKIWQSAWLDNEAIVHQLQSVESITLETDPGIGQIRMKIAPIRGPPAGSQSLEITGSNITIRGQFDLKDGRIFVSWKELPESIRKDPSVLQKSILDSDIERIRHTSPREGQTIQYKIPETRFADNEGFIRRPFREIAKDLQKNPQEFKTRIDQDLAERLKQSNKYFAQENFGKAIQCLQDAIDFYGLSRNCPYPKDLRR